LRKNSSGLSRTVHDYIATLAFVTAPPAIFQRRENVTFKLRATNSGVARWPAIGAPDTKGIVRLGAHLLSADEEEVEWDGGRAILPRDLEPGESAEMEFVSRAPNDPGNYIIEFDMVADTSPGSKISVRAFCRTISLSLDYFFAFSATEYCVSSQVSFNVPPPAGFFSIAMVN
jgi:hypothetical protein